MIGKKQLADALGLPYDNFRELLRVMETQVVGFNTGSRKLLTDEQQQQVREYWKNLPTPLVRKRDKKRQTAPK